MSGEVWILVTAVLLAAVSAVLGSFLLMRRMALVGDTLSHAVVPGIVAAYLWSGVRDYPVMLLGAGFSAAIALVTVQLLQRRFGWHSDTALAAVLSSFFALGVLLLSAFAGNVDLDVECVLYGEIAYVPLDLWAIAGGRLVLPRAVLLAAGLLLAVALVVVVAYKELLLTTFDPEFAATVGIAPGVWQGVLVGMTTLVTIVGFELVGAVLIVSLLVVPAAAARLVARRFPAMLWGAVGLGCSSALAGFGMAQLSGGAIAGWMSTVAAAEFALLFLWRRWRSQLEQAPPPPQDPFAREAS
jgi:manganese/zinc/iron transport system permease protein